MPFWSKKKQEPEVDEFGRDSFWYHAADGNLLEVKRCLKEGRDPSVGDKTNFTPLHVSVQNGHIDVIQTLLENGAEPNIVDEHSNGSLWTALLSSPHDKTIEIVTLLLEFGADPDHINKYGNSPRKMAEEIGNGVEIPFKE